MENHRTKTYCYYCQENLATLVRDIPLKRSNGYKLADFEAQLCEDCNYLTDEILSEHFSV